jgi:hypothetical protein
MVNKSIRETRTNGGSKPYSTDLLFNVINDSYLERTSRPIYAVLFLMPFIIFYELGTFFINTNFLNQYQIRVVAFVWLQQWLTSLGFGGKFAWVTPGLAAVVILLSQQITSGRKWNTCFSDFLVMAVESILLAVPLIVLTLLLNTIGSPENPSISTNSIYKSISLLSGLLTTENTIGQSIWANIVTGIGAGIYEELVFRLILICLLMILFQDVIKLKHGNAIMLSVFISAGLFSAHHHIDFFTGRENSIDPFDWGEFIFRTIAGIYFAFLYAIRGFGITAGTHSFYNIIAVSITAGFYGK